MKIGESNGIEVFAKTEYQISTRNAEKFLQEKFNAITALINSKGGNEGEVSVELFTAKFSDNFAPIICTLSTNALKNKKGKANQSELSIFSSEENSGSVRFKAGYDDLIAGLSFSQGQLKSLNNPRVKKELNITSSNDVVFIKREALPSVKKYGNGNRKYVSVLIDPIKLFKNMLKNTDFNKVGGKSNIVPSFNGDFDVEISSLKQIEGMNYRYGFAVPDNSKGKKGKGNASIQKHISDAMRNRRSNGR